MCLFRGDNPAMKILAVNKFYYVHGGSDRYFFELNELCRRAGHLVVPFAMQHPRNLPTPYKHYFVSQVNYWSKSSLLDKIKAASRILYSMEARRKIRLLIEDEKPDIVHLHLIYHQISPSILPVIKEYGLPVIQTLHDYKPICPTYNMIAQGKTCERCKGKRFYHAVLQRCSHGSLVLSALNAIEMYLHYALGWYDLPDIYITPSDFMRRKMIEFGMSPQKLVHIPNFIDINKYAWTTTSDDTLIYAGRLVRVKGIETLIQAMARIQSIGIKLVIVGDGPQRTELESLKSRLNLHNVEFCGYQSGAALRALMANAMFSVLPSEWYENCPMSVLESMAMGKPVIGARIGGIPELIDHEIDGLLFEPGNATDLADKIKLLATNPALRQEMGNRARQKMANQYDAQHHYEAILDVYRQVM